MQNMQSDRSSLPMMAMDDVPTPKDDAKTIVALQKQGGKISGYQLSDGRMVSREEGVQLARRGEIRGVGISHRKDTAYLKALPDDSDSNNLSSLPTVQ